VYVHGYIYGDLEVVGCSNTQSCCCVVAQKNNPLLLTFALDTWRPLDETVALDDLLSDFSRDMKASPSATVEK
jgi:hypothetical protein